MVPNTYEYWREWRLSHQEYRNKSRKRYFSKTSFAPRGGQVWTSEEQRLVLAHEMTDMELAAKIGRSVGAIQKQRAKLKREMD